MNSNLEVKVVKDGDGRFIIEGQEATQVYFSTEKIVFSVSTLLPGQKACLDNGHKDADEICYVIAGKIIMHLTNIDKYFLLNEGDAMLIPPGEPHYSINIGEKKSITAWSCAPKL